MDRKLPKAEISRMDHEKQRLLEKPDVWPSSYIYLRKRNSVLHKLCGIATIILALFVLLFGMLALIVGIENNHSSLGAVLPLMFTYRVRGPYDMNITITWDRTKEDFRYQENRYFEEATSNTTMVLSLVQNVEFLKVGSNKTCGNVNIFPKLYMYKMLNALPTARRIFRKHAWCSGQIWLLWDVKVCTIDSIPVSMFDHGEIFRVYDFQPVFDPSVIEHDCQHSPEDTNTINLSLTSQNSPQKHCLFIHGAGEFRNQKIFEVKDSFYSYWGNITEMTPQCSSHQFILYNSVDLGWDDDTLLRNICRVATKGQGKFIKGTKVFTHSMGNLVFAAALHSKHCHLENSSDWYSAQAPWKGSEIANKVACFCDNTCTVFKIPFFITNDIIKLTKYCHRNGSLTAAYASLRTDYVSPNGITFQDLSSTARHYMTGAMCGKSPVGSLQSTSVSVELFILQFATALDKPNDGLVALNSCNITGKFSDDYKSNFYLDMLNHAEGTCRFGYEAKVNKAHPCLWYANS